MSARPTTHRFVPGVAAALTVLALLAGCAGGYPETPLAPTPTAAATATSSPGTPSPTPPPPACTEDPLPSYAPAGTLAAAAQAAEPRLAQIRQRGFLVAGVSADTLLMGARNPFTGRIEGFDIDIVRELAKAVLGDPEKVQLVVITAAQRQSALVGKQVDVVARNMTMTCTRWRDWPIAFSGEYYRAGLKVLVRTGSPATSLPALATAKARVCAPAGTTTLDAVRAAESAGVVPVSSSTHTGCLVLFQQGKVDAIAGDDTVLAGLAAQDPYAVVPQQQPLSAEPYGLGFNAEDKEFVRYANRVLEGMKADGRWKAVYDRWLAARLGPAPTPPVARYGRG